VGWVHNNHAHGGTVDASGEIETTWETGMSYAGWGRLHYYNGMLAMLGFLGQKDSMTGQKTDSLTGAKNFVYTRSE
jgi:hypothetical protein